jgi:hypothetical protein
MSRNTIGIALLGLLVVAAIALPASAAQANGKAAKVDPGLKNDLWGVYGEYRLRVYDTHVEGANAAVGVLEGHGCPAGELAATVTAIEEERTPLSEAIGSRDRKALQDVNKELARLWKQFREQVKASVKACSGQDSGNSDKTAVSED